MTRAYVLSPGAAADLRKVAHYSEATWGEAQRRTYIAKLEAATQAVALGEGMFKDMSAILPGLRMVWSGKHCVFCLPRRGQRAEIVAIFHERMDIIARLHTRLR